MKLICNNNHRIYINLLYITIIVIVIELLYIYIYILKNLNDKNKLLL